MRWTGVLVEVGLGVDVRESLMVWQKMWRMWMGKGGWWLATC